MAGDGPTTAGSIVGKLKLDISDWTTKIKAAELAARDLAKQNPTISIDVDDNGAITKMEAVAAAAKALGGAEQDLDVKTKQASQSAGGYASRWQIIAGLIAAAVPLIAPLSSAVVGLAGGLLGLGAAAALGVYGVIAAIKQGTAVGDQYSASLKVLKSQLDSLGNTAATKLLSSFNQGVSLINGSLPQLNAEIGQFATILGRTGVFALQGVLNLLRELNPLFVQGAQYVQNLAMGFEAWTTNGGLQQFVSYAEREMPRVLEMLGDLVQVVANVVIALAPVGEVAVTVLGGLADVINSIPLPVLTAMAVGAAGVAVAFGTWRGISAIIDTVTARLTAMGVAEAATEASSLALVGGMAAASAGLAYFASQSIDAAKEALGLEQSIDSLYKMMEQGKTASAVTKQTSADIAGFSTNVSQLAQVTNSGWANGLVKGLFDSYHAALQFQPVLKAMGLDSNDFSGKMDKLDQAMAKLVTSGHIDQARAAYQQLASQTDGSGQALKNLNVLLPNFESAMKGAGASIDTSTSSVEALKTAENNAKTATDQFAQALKGLGDVNLSADQANIAFQQSLADTNATIAKNGKTLNESTQAGRDNMSALDGMASASFALVAAQAKQGTSEVALQATMANSRTAFIRAAEAAGLTAQQAGALADKYHLIPKDVNTAYHQSGAAAAIDAAAAVRSAVNNIPRTVVVSVQMAGVTGAQFTQKAANGVGRPKTGSSLGGPIHKGMADGGFSGAVQGMGNAFNDQAGLYPLADGEFVVSDRFKQATKYASTLSAMNRGASAMQVAAAAMADGGVRFRGGGQQVYNHYHNTYNVYASDPNELAQKVSMRQNRMGVV